MVKALILGLLIGLLAFLSFGRAAEITFENCMPGTWIGGVKWEWKDGVRGNHIGSTYIDIPELELKNVGSLVVDLEPGDYGVTHYRPAYSGQDRSGRRMIFHPSAFLEFREVEVGTLPSTHSFGCEE